MILCIKSYSVQMFVLIPYILLYLKMLVEEEKDLEGKIGIKLSFKQS